MSSPVPAHFPAVPVPAQASGPDPFGLGSSNVLGSQFQLSFTLTTPPAERKRPLGTPCRYEEHRQARSGSQAVQAGYQMRRGLVKPFFPLEVEPGQAARHALSVVHPFNSDVALDPVLAANIKQVCDETAKVVAARFDLLTCWKQRAIDLLPATLAELQKVSDAPLRRLLRGVPDDQTPELGQCLHTALWRELARSGQCTKPGAHR